MSEVDAREMRAIEETAFRRGVDAGDLMDQAGYGLATRLLDHFPHPGTSVAYLGKGNNAGDALVILDHLRQAGWNIAFRALHPHNEWSSLTRQRFRRLGDIPDAVPSHGSGPLLLLDGLLGIGASGPPRPPLDDLVAEMNALRLNRGAHIAAIDLPSGLDASTGAPGGLIADLTLTIGVPKRGLFADQATPFVGRLFLVPLDDLPAPDRPGPRLFTPDTFPGLLPPRPHQVHKGLAGRVSILAGSPGMGGAAVLASQAALRSGAGLVTLHLDPDTEANCPPEVMVRRSTDRLAGSFESQADALVIGPGLGQQDDSLLELLADDSRPCVLDADALNRIAAARRQDLLAPHHLLTPHPGEFARLAPDLADLPRAEAARAFVDRHPCTLLLKGARTLVAAPNEDIRVNPTGHAGMASGGQGDTLAGVCGALLAGGVAPVDAASLGAWLCGRAAERAITHDHHSPESLTASDTAMHLGGAFTDWRERRR